MENPTNALKRIHCTVHGEVQGVGFRAFTARQAGELGIFGWVRNQMNGSVEIEVEGPEDKIAVFMDLIRRGPRHSSVENLEIHEECNTTEPRHTGFAVRF